MTKHKPAGTQLTRPGLRPAGMLGAALLSLLQKESGSQIVELGLVLIPLLGFVFLILDIAWVCFAQATLQHAVQTGVRAAITSYLPQGVSSQPAYIKSIVQTNAMGFLGGQTGLNYITINCYDPSNLTAPTGCSGGDVIEVGVQNVPVSLLGPVIGTNWTTIKMTASSSDVMESAPAAS